MNAGLPHTLSIKRAEAALAADRLAEARSLCDAVLRERRNDPAATMVLSQIAWREGDRDEAIDLLAAHVKRHPSDAAGRANLGRFLSEVGRFDQAAAQFEALLRASPNDPHAIAGQAETLELNGQGELARARLEPIAQAGRETAAMARVLARLEVGAGRFDRAIALAGRHADDPAADPFFRLQLHFLIGAAQEKSGDFDAAFESYQRAHAIQRPAYDIAHERRLIERFIAAFSARALGMLPRTRTDSSKIVFIVGRPRSGTTLIERIIASHPHVHAAGEMPTLIRLTHRMNLAVGSMDEYPECVSQLDQSSADDLSQAYLDRMLATAPRAARITDKHLYTWRHLGLVELLWPLARIIDVRRDALDNCLACFSAPLGDRYPFSYDLRDLGLSHRLYERLMSHWHSTLHVPMLTVRYEDVVGQQEAMSRRMIEFIGLPWHERCLRFHEPTAGSARSRPAAPTLSYNQVRQPMYASSVGRAQRFGERLRPLIEALGE